MGVAMLRTADCGKRVLFGIYFEIGLQTFANQRDPEYSFFPVLFGFQKFANQGIRTTHKTIFRGTRNTVL
jgi:hypothetical protein